MVPAYIKGKIPSDYEGMEDMLTSAVFSLLRYDVASDLVLRFLAQAKNLSSEYPLLNSAPDWDIRKVSFWEKWRHVGCNPCEPDVVIRGIDRRTQQRFLLCVEVKLHSGLSSGIDPTSELATHQLAREWDNAKAEAGDDCAVWLIYLTSHAEAPRAELRDAVANSADAEKTLLSRHILWLSWHSLYAEASDQTAVERDVKLMLERLNVTPLQAFSALQRNQVTWSFDAPVTMPAFNWDVVANPLLWRFNDTR